MDKFGDYISLVLKGTHLSKARREELREEFYDHLEMLKIELIKEGHTEEESELMAMERFGEINNINKNINRVFTPLQNFKEIMDQKKLFVHSFNNFASFAFIM